jgi:hypothetical protein
VGLTLNGRNLNITAYRTLQGLADDILNSLMPDEVRLLVSLLGPVVHHPSNPLPDDFWDAIKAGQKIVAIKELRKASGLNLKSSKDIVDAIMSDYSEDQDKDAPLPEDKSDDDELRCDFDCDHCHADDDKPEDQDDAGDEPEDSDEGEPEEGEPGGDDGADGEPGDGEFGDGEGGVEADYNGEDVNGDTATADALADLAKRAHDNGKEHSEDEIRKALETLGISF